MEGTSTLIGKSLAYKLTNFQTNAFEVELTSGRIGSKTLEYVGWFSQLLILLGPRHPKLETILLSSSWTSRSKSLRLKASGLHLLEEPVRMRIY